MATSVGSLVADLQLKSAQFISELQKTNSRLGRFEGGLKRMSTVGVRAFKSLAIAAGGVGLASLGKQAIEATDRIGKLSDRLGASTESLSELGFAAELSGVQFNTLAQGLQRMQRRVAEAAVGTGEAKKALFELGIDARKLVQLDLDNQFEIIAEALSRLGSDADRTRLSMKLFDSEGVALLQTMQDGAEGIQRMRQQGRALGVTISQDMARRAAEAADNMTEFKVAIQALARSVALSVLPDLTRFAQWLARHLPEAIAKAKATWNEFIAFFQEKVAAFLHGAQALVRGLSEIVATFGAEDTAASIRGVASTIELMALSFDSAAESSMAAAEAYRSQAAELAALREKGPKAGGTGAKLEDVLGTGAPEIKPTVKIQKVPKADLDNLAGTIESAIQGGVEGGWKGALNSILQSIQRNFLGQLAKMVAGAFGSGGNNGGTGGFGQLISSLFSGYRYGGQFTVGGSGGPDSKLVAFRATPGEQVAITTPGQSVGGAVGITINQNINGNTSRDDARQIAQETAAAVKAEMYDLKSRGRF